MKKHLLLFVTGILLVACIGTAQNLEPFGDYSLEDVPVDAIILNKQLVDDDDIKVVIISVDPEPPELSDGVSHINLYVENKFNQPIYLDIRKVYMDGIAPDYHTFSDLIDVNANSTETLEISYSNHDLPTLEESLEFTLRVQNKHKTHLLSTYKINLEF